jgi:hypothetical protein
LDTVFFILQVTKAPVDFLNGLTDVRFEFKGKILNFLPMAQVRLELNKIQIHRPKERWQLYFVVVADHPTEKNQVAVTMQPSRPILVVPEQHNHVYFEPAGRGSEGLLLLSRKMPPTCELNVHLHVMHSRRSGREIGKVLDHIAEAAGKGALGKEVELLGITSPWLRVARASIPLIGQALSALPDRNLGFISMFERFGSEFELETEVDREVRGGHVTAVYTWSVSP